MSSASRSNHEESSKHGQDSANFLWAFFCDTLADPGSLILKNRFYIIYFNVDSYQSSFSYAQLASWTQDQRHAGSQQWR